MMPMKALCGAASQCRGATTVRQLQTRGELWEAAGCVEHTERVQLHWHARCEHLKIPRTLRMVVPGTRHRQAMMGALYGSVLLVLAALAVVAMVLPQREDLVAPGRRSELVGTAALSKSLSAECPCLAQSLSAQQSLSDCPCADAIAVAVAKALNGNMYAPPPPPPPRQKPSPAYPPGT